MRHLKSHIQLLPSTKRELSSLLWAGIIVLVTGDDFTHQPTEEPKSPCFDAFSGGINTAIRLFCFNNHNQDTRRKSQADPTP